MTRTSTPDTANMESVVRDSGLKWIITRPAVLTDGPATGDVHVFATGSRDNAQAITRADLAAFLVAHLTVDDHVRESVTVGSR